MEYKDIEKINTSKKSIKLDYKKIAIILYIIAVIFIITGFVIMYYYGDYDAELNIGNKFGHIVGGDAYNFIIIGIRGLGFIMTGLTVSLLGSTLLIYDVLQNKEGKDE
jgi:hypothetical protein